MPHYGERRGYEPDSADLVLAGRAFSPRPLPPVAGVASSVVVDESSLVLAQRVFGRRAPDAPVSSAAALDASDILAVRAFSPRNTPVTSTSSTPSGGLIFTYASTSPVGPNPGDEWVDSDTGILYTYVDDGLSSQWVEF